MDLFFQVNAFARVPFGGNPAAVIIMETEWTAELMQNVAKQNNLPATAFVYFSNSGIKLRWFTAKKELTLCGHATLAAAHVLFSKSMVPPGEKIHFSTGNADLYAWTEDGWITLDFPAYPCAASDLPSELKLIFEKKFKSAFYTQDKFLIELEDETAVRNFVPDSSALINYKCIITARGDKASPYDFVSRFFDLPDGIQEDAVTGSAHCSLATFWSSRLNKNQMYAFQASSRGGELKLLLDRHRVLISGQALTIIEGSYLPFIQKESQKNQISSRLRIDS